MRGRIILRYFKYLEIVPETGIGFKRPVMFLLHFFCDTDNNKRCKKPKTTPVVASRSIFASFFRHRLKARLKTAYEDGAR